MCTYVCIKRCKDVHLCKEISTQRGRRVHTITRYHQHTHAQHMSTAYLHAIAPAWACRAHPLAVEPPCPPPPAAPAPQSAPQGPGPPSPQSRAPPSQAPAPPASSGPWQRSAGPLQWAPAAQTPPETRQSPPHSRSAFPVSHPHPGVPASSALSLAPHPQSQCAGLTGESQREACPTASRAAHPQGHTGRWLAVPGP